MKLTIVILQWGRLDWLEAAVRTLARQITPDNSNDVEILVSDDGFRNRPPIGGFSREDTVAVLDRCACPNLVYARRGEDDEPGTPNNMSRAIRMAKGDYLWMLGNDDLVKSGGLEAVLNGLKTNARIECLFLNHGVWTPYVPPADVDALDAAQPLRWHIDDFTNRFLPTLGEIALADRNAFTASYTVLLKTTHWKLAFQHWQGEGANMWTDLAQTSPYMSYIIDNLLDKPAYYLGQKILLASYRCTWHHEAASKNWGNLLELFRQRIRQRLAEIRKIS